MEETKSTLADRSKTEQRAVVNNFFSQCPNITSRLEVDHSYDVIVSVYLSCMNVRSFQLCETPVSAQACGKSRCMAQG
jgi:hypothetical protein